MASQLENPEDTTASQCDLMGSTGVALQGALAFLSFCVLIYKRFKERPRRSWKIWFLDTSKQGFSATTSHGLNLILSMWLAGDVTGVDADPCAWYFITIAFDTTIGVFISVFLLIMLEKLFKWCGYDRMKSGNYFKVSINNDPSTSLFQPQKVIIDYTAWGLQVCLWIVIVLMAKSILGYLQKTFEVPLQEIATIIFYGINPFPFIKLLLVLVVVPTVGNGFQFWINDNFLKKTEFEKEESLVLKGTFFDADLTMSDDATLSKSDSNDTTESFAQHKILVEMGVTSPSRRRTTKLF